MTRSPRHTFRSPRGLLPCVGISLLTTLAKGWQPPYRANILSQRRIDSSFVKTAQQALYYSSEDDNLDHPPKLFSSTAELWEGAGLPRPELGPEEIPSLLMKALGMNDFPDEDSGLECLWDFSSGMLRQSAKQNITAFIESAHHDAENIPTSFYGMALNGKSWDLETAINRVGGENGYLATQIVKTVCEDGRMRRWQFMLRKNRRPPNLNCWFVESVGASDWNGNFHVND